MAANTLSENITLAIKNADGSSFYNLSLKKFTIDSQVMSLGDKITGDVYYKDNNLPFTMREYVEYDGVKYTLVNPPTVVKEGMVRDNSENKGMTKYSLEFYHPMYQLGNMPFNDVAVSYNESSYMSESATFSWVGYPDDYIAKLNKNLQGTQWIVVKSSNFQSSVESQISEVLAFDKESIADALKKMYETWELPYIVDKVGSSESSYAQGKRFKVIVGMPSAEIYEQGSQDPFVFQYGQGVGLKNNSRSPRNNKIITRIAGYGSERNIPYGYPQIVWTGSTSDSRLQYPLYDGIVGGQPVKLIKHPFTRKTLMPSIYVETVYNKVNPLLPNGSANPNYNPNTEIIEYYDATAAENYPNPINPLAPSYETHEFEDIYPRLGTASIVGVVPSDKDAKTYVPFDQIDDVIDKYIDNSSSYPEKDFLWECKGMVITTGMEEINYDKNVDTHSFVFTLTHDDTFLYLEYKSNDLQNFKFTALRYGVAPPTPAWDDTMDDKGEYTQSYMEITLPVLGFDIYACASITEQMQINMRSGACIGCTFDVAVDWDDYKKNFFNADGDFVPDGAQRDLVKYPKSNETSITVTAKKDLETFGTLMPNRYQQPQAGDEFVILGISLPLSYIQSAEAELADAAKAYMRENNIYYFDYPLKFDEFFLRNNDHILSQIKPNAIVHFNYAGDTKDLYIKQLTTKVGYAPLPQFDITLTDNIEVSLNQIGQTVDELGKLSDVVALLRRQTEDGLLAAVMSKLSKTDDDTANGLIRFMKGLQIGRSFSSGILGSGGIIGVDADGKTYLEVDEIYARIKAVFDNVEVKNYQHSVGNRMVTKAGIKCSRVEWVDENGEYVEQNQANLSSVVSFRCFYRAKDTDDTVNNDFVAGVNEEDGKGTQDLAFCDSTNIASGVNKRSYWRAVVGKNANGTFTLDGEGWIDLSKADCRANSDIPMAGDDIIQLGNVTDKDRQGAIVEYIGGNDAPCYKIYQEIGLDERTDEEREQDPPVPFNPYVLTDKCFIDFGYSRTTKRAYMNVYGDMYVGEKGNNPSTYIRYTQPHKEWVTPEPTEEVPEPEPELVTIPAKLEIKAIIDAQSTMGGKTFQNIFQNIQDQLDGIIDNYFLEGVPTLLTPPVVSTQEHPYLNPWLTGQETPEQRAIIFNNHLGDLYYDKLTDLAYRFESSYDPETEITTYSWQPISDDAIAEALRLANKAQDTADGKRRVFSVTPFSPYDDGDLWVNVTGTFTKRDGTSVTYNNDILKCIAPIPRSGAQEGDPDIDTFNISDWSLASGYTDDTYAHGFDYLSSNLAQLSTTQIAGGLVLSSLIGLRDSNNNIQSGISGIIDTTQGGKKGGGIAAWYGGEQGDLEDTEHYPVTRFAKSLFRFDGSGYLAGGNIKWTADGRVYLSNIQSQSGQAIDQYFFDAFGIGLDGNVRYINPNFTFSDIDIVRRAGAGYTINDNSVLSRAENDARYLLIQRFFDLFDVYNGSTNYTETFKASGLPSSTANISIKAKFGLWTEQYLSALGQNSQGSGGGVTELAMLDDVSLSNVQAGQVLKARIVGNNVEWYNANENTGTVTSIRIGTDIYSPTAGVITLPDYPTDYYSSIASRTANTVLAAPDGAPGAALFRSLVANDIPSLPASKINTGTFDAALIPEATTTTVGGIIVGTTLAIADSILNLANSGVTAGTYRSVTVDSYGRVTAGTNPTTLAGYGITDAGIASGVITLGGNTITPVTDVFVGTGDNANKIGKTIGGATTYFTVPFATNATNATNATYVSTTADTTNTLYLVGVTSGATTTLKRDTLITMTGGALTMSGALKLSGSTAATRRIYFGDNEHYLELDANGFHFSHGVYSDGFVSALGLNSQGGGGGGATYLYELEDVNINDSTLANGQVLIHQNGDWVNGTIPAASAATYGGIKIGYSGTGKNYAVVLDSNGMAYVNVPWEDNNTWIAWVGATASANGTAGYMPAPTIAQRNQFLRGDGTWVDLNNYSLPLAANGTRGGIQIGYSESGKYYAVKLSSEKAYVYVPWTNTTYKLTLNGTTNGDSTNGVNLGTLYAVATSNATAANQVWMRNAANTGYAWRTLGSMAFDSGSYLPLSGGTLTGALTTQNVEIPNNYTLKIGDAYLKWDNDNNAVKVYKLNGSTEVAVNLYATGGVSALGVSDSGSGGGVDMDVVWTALANNTNEQINATHLSTALAGYATQAWVQLQGYITSYTDTKNTAGSTNLANTKLFIIGAQTQAANPQTYSHVNCYIGTDGCLYSGGAKVLTSYTEQYTGTVTSVAMTVPTGFSVSGTPITTSGTLALTYASGYEGFTTTLKDKINLLYSLFTREGSGTTEDPYVIKANYGLYTDQFLSALGLNSSGSSGATVLSDLTDVEYNGTPSDGQVLKYSNGKWRNGTDLNIGTVTAIKLGATGTSYSPTDGVVTLPAYPTTLPASDVYSWAKASTKPSYTLDEVLDGETRKLSNYLALSGGTMTGALTLLANQYEDSYSSGALFLSNSNIQGVNSIYTADLADNAAEGLHFYRDTTHVDTLWIANGVMYFVPNRALGTSTTASNSNVVLHSGNWGSYVGTTTNPVANATNADTANKLSTASKTLFGNTYWTSGGVPTSIGTSSAPAGLSYVTHVDSILYFDRTNNRVGINTDTPTVSLDVNGHAKTTRLYLAANVYLEYNSNNSGVHLVGAGFYSDSYVSALGANTSGGGGGSSTLAGLTDVNVGSQTQGQVLGWDGQSHWVPMNMPSTSNFVTLNSTQTITGQKTFTSAVTAQSLWSNSVWADGTFSVYDYTTDFSILHSSGSHVGIGTSSDTNYTLKVGGNTKVNGSMTLTGSSVVATLSVNSNSRFNDGTGVFAYTSEIPTDTNQLTNGAGFVTSSDKVAGLITQTPSSLDGTAGNWVGSFSSIIVSGNDYVVLQADSGVDKFQLTVDGNNLYVRQNDTGGTNSTNWGPWSQLLTSAAISVPQTTPVLSWGNSSVLATIGGTNISVSMPPNPVTYGTTAGTAAEGNHTHSLSITGVTPQGATVVELLANTAYTLTAGGNTIYFKTPQGTTISNYITTDTDQNNLGGAKTWTQNASGQAIVTGNISTKIEYTGITFSAKALGVSGTTTYTLAADTTGLKIGSNYIIHSGNIGSQSVNYATSAGTATDSTKVALSGDTMTGTLTLPKIRINGTMSSSNVTKGIYYYDGTTDYLLIGQGSANLWIGANETVGTHHVGSTYISAGDGNLYASKLVSNNRGNYLIIDEQNWSSYIGTSNAPVANATYATSAGSATDSTKLPLTGGTITADGVKVEYNNYNVKITNNKIHFGITSGSSEVIASDLKMEDDTTTGKVGRLKVGSEYLAYLSDITAGGAVDSVCGYTGTVTASNIGDALIAANYQLTDNNTARLRVGNVTNKTICTTENTEATIQFTGGTDGFTVTDGLKSFTVPVTTTGTTYSQGTGISISGTTISMSSTYRTYCSNGNTAYGWGNHANAGYLTSHQSLSGCVKTTGENTISGRFTFNGPYDTRMVFDDPSDYYQWILFRKQGTQYGWLGTNDNTNIKWNDFTIYHSGNYGSSDVRLKNIIKYGVTPSVESIAYAPSILFSWNEKAVGRENTIGVGSIAQYWKTVMPEAVHQGEGGYLLMQYDVIALLAAISIAKKVVNHEERIAELESENIELRNEINNLKAA